MAYFERVGAGVFRPTEHVSGAWAEAEQHIAPAFGLLTHEIERYVEEGADTARVTRLSFDILGVLRMQPFEVAVAVVRPGRTIELVEARLTQDGRDAVVARVWRQATHEVSVDVGTPDEPIPGPEQAEPWDASSEWPGGFIRSIEVRRTHTGAGRGRVWARTAHPLVEGDEVSELARFVGLLDIANGMNTRADPSRVAFPNLDLTAHLHTAPRGEWVGLDTRVSFADDGIGLTHSTVHDVHGPVGVSSQILTVRPR